jgi:hypothetical protein
VGGVRLKAAGVGWGRVPPPPPPPPGAVPSTKGSL